MAMISDMQPPWCLDRTWRITGYMPFRYCLGWKAPIKTTALSKENSDNMGFNLVQVLKTSENPSACHFSGDSYMVDPRSVATPTSQVGLRH